MWDSREAVRRLLQGRGASQSGSKAAEQIAAGCDFAGSFVNLVEPDPMRRLKLRITHEKT